jgi:hypothetical protein
MSDMSSSDSIDAPDIDPAIAEAVDGVTNRFGTEGLEAMIAYAEQSLTDARAALEELADTVE